MSKDKMTTGKNFIRIAIIEDDEIIRKGYAYLLKTAAIFDVVTDYASYELAATAIAADAPDVILLDIQLPGISGIDAVPRLKQLSPHSIIIMLTVHEDPDMIFKALTQGAAGYLTKDTPSSKIIESIKDAMTGGGPLSTNVARIVIQSFQKNQDSPLTKREEQVLQLISDGKSRSQISTDLFIDLETVKTHIKNIYLKLNVHSRADAIRTAKNNRLVR
jgi:DNA-binding NarL/FixJ family response regulator